MMKVLCPLANTELTCLPERAPYHSVCEKVNSIRCLFYFQRSTVNIYKYKGKYLLWIIPHVCRESLNPFSISNKQEHIKYQLRHGALRFFLTQSEPLRTINAFVNVLIVTLFQFSHTKELLII